MDNFFGTPKSTLLDTIKSQQERLGKYEKKLGDLIKAYKILQDEKNALQSTVTALSSTAPDATDDTAEMWDPLQGDGPATMTLRQQISALTKSLSSLSETKATLESRFQADKKELLEQVDNLKCSLAAEEACSGQARIEHNSTIQTMRGKLRHEQHEREQEQTHHVAMLRELQQMLATERSTTQRLELELEETRSDNTADTMRTSYDNRVEELTTVISDLNGKLVQASKKLNEPSPSFLLLEKELSDLRIIQREREAHRRSIESSIQQQSHQRSNADQQRIHDLENRVTELSELLADYDVHRKKDQDEIYTLKGRVSQLESVKTPQAPQVEHKAVHVSINNNIVVDSNNIKGSWTDSASPTTTTSHIADIVQYTPPGIRRSISLREAEVAQLKEQLRIYKQEMVSVEQIKVLALQKERKVHQQQMIRITSDHERHFKELASAHSQELDEVERGNSIRLVEIQSSSKSARLRSQTLLDEKEEEISSLRIRIDALSIIEKPAQDMGTVGELLSSVETETIPRTLIFYKQQYKYFSEEVVNLKKHKDILEITIREKERNEHIYLHELNQLKNEVRRLVRNNSRESANLEYLKNIVLRYLQATVSSEKRQILLAILTVLEFSPLEKDSVKHKLAPGWFN